MTTSISQTEQSVNEEKCTAIIYSISDLGYYLVEIRHQGQQHFIESKNDPKQFGNLDEAKVAAKKEGAEMALLALSKTYQEVDQLSETRNDNYDYMPIEL